MSIDPLPYTNTLNMSITKPLTVDIFYKSYQKDFWLLHYSLISLAKNVTGYNNIILLIPENEKHDFDTRNLPERTLIHYVNEEGNGYLFQQWCKINAAQYSTADFILFADSDCIFDHPIDLSTFIPYPEILYTDYKQLPDAIIWQKPTSALIGEKQQYEFMRRNCLIYHRSTLININKWNTGLKEIILNSDRFSEFNLIGAYAFKYEQGNYNFINTDDCILSQPKSQQVWSHASKEKGADELHLREFIRILETIIKALGI